MSNLLENKKLSLKDQFKQGKASIPNVTIILNNCRKHNKKRGDAFLSSKGVTLFFKTY